MRFTLSVGSIPTAALLLWIALPKELSAVDLPTSRPVDVGMSAERLDEIDDAMQRSIADGQIAGGVVMVARNGKVAFHRAYGKMNIEGDKPMRPDTIVRIYSMTKAITTVAALMLCDEGKLDVNDPVSKYLPEIPDRSMTVADLMRHTAGYSYGQSHHPAHDKAFEELNLMQRDKTLVQLQANLAKLPLAFPPGTDWMYGISTDVLGRVVEVVSGESLDDFFNERIFTPLEMVDTGFYVPPDKLDRFAANYQLDAKGTLRLKDDPETSDYRGMPAMHSGGGGLVSTATDYMRFLMMISDGGRSGDVRLLKPETVALMTTNQLPAGVGWIKFGTEIRTGIGFGLGFNVRVESSDWDPDGRVGEYGWGGAASTHYWVSPADDLIVVTLEQVMPYQWLTERKLKGLIYAAIDRE